MQYCDPDSEKLNQSLNDPAFREEYKKPYDEYRPHWLPRFFGALLVGSGDLVYGKGPSYLKFRAIEVIARVPYHSWESAAFTFLSMFYMNEKKAMELSKISWLSRIASDNETMHVVVISALAKHARGMNVFAHTFVPTVFAFFYFWFAYWLYVLSPRYALELNFIFEDHAYHQYSEFLEKNADALKAKKMESEYLKWYGRTAQNEFEFFESVRNDELIHRNRSIEEIPKK